MSQRFVGFFLAFSILILAPCASAFGQVLPWYEGVFQNIGTNFNCITQSVEIRVQGYAAQSWHDARNPPAVGEVFYAQVVLSHPGNPCGGSAVGVELLLPPGVQTAISAENPVFCFAYAPPNSQHSNAILYNLANDAGYGCPQTLSRGLEGLALIPPRGGIGGSYSWGMAQGFWLELMVPLVATAPQPGNNNVAFRVNPDVGVVGYPKVPTFIDGDVVFRAANENQTVLIDLCTVSPRATGC